MAWSDTIKLVGSASCCMCKVSTAHRLKQQGTKWQDARTTGLHFVLHICILFFFFFPILLHPHSMLNKKRRIPPTWLPVLLRLENWGPCAACPVITVSSARQMSCYKAYLLAVRALLIHGGCGNATPRGFLFGTSIRVECIFSMTIRVFCTFTCAATPTKQKCQILSCRF